MDTDSEKRAAILKGIREELVLCRRQIEKFKEKFNNHPSYALEWADSDFTAVAFEKLYSQAEGFLTKTEPRIIPLNEILKEYQEQLVRKAKRSRSSSVCSDLLETNYLVALGELVELLTTGYVWHT